jgi:hypothetical protein
MEVIQKPLVSAKNANNENSVNSSKLNRSLNSSLRLRTTSGQDAAGKTNNALIRKYSDKINRNLMIHIEPVPFLSKASSRQEHKRSCPLPITSTLSTAHTTAPNAILIIKNDLSADEERGSLDGLVDTGLIETEIEKVAENTRRFQFKKTKLKKTNSRKENKKLILAAASAIADGSDGFSTSTSLSGNSSIAQVTPPPVPTQHHKMIIVSLVELLDSE